jgi:hypothetical protein
MKKLLVLFLILAVLAATTPAAAKQQELVGDRIPLFFVDPDQTFPADTPFHIRHGVGFTVPVGGDARGRSYEFKLDVDGVPQQADAVLIETYPYDSGSFQSWQWLYNFPNGMTGAHTFTGHLLGPCADLVSGGNYSGSCGSNPMATVEADISPQSVTVTFVP